MTSASGADAAAAGAAGTAGPDVILDVRDLTVVFGKRGRKGGTTIAVDRVSFAVRTGETLGIVGESGSGKTTTARAILQLAPITAGTVHFKGDELTRLSGRALRARRRDMQMVFQDPYGSLNPRMTVGEAIGEPMLVHRTHDAGGARARVRELLDVVGLPASAAGRYPAEFSGGQRQRINLARALAVEPSLVVADEPTSALDVSIQAQVIRVLQEVQHRFALTYVFISHDLSLVRLVSDRVAVMYAGRVVELAGVDHLYSDPLHPYTQVLLSSIPIPDPALERARRAALPEVGPETAEEVNRVATACPFAPRCAFARDRCTTEEPPLAEAEPGRWVACHYWPEVRAKPPAGLLVQERPETS